MADPMADLCWAIRRLAESWWELADLIEAGAASRAPLSAGHLEACVRAVERIAVAQQAVDTITLQEERRAP